MKQYKTFYKIFISYLFILIIPMSLHGGVNYYNSLKVVQKNIEKDTLSALTQGADIIDSRAIELSKLTSELSVDQRIINLIYTLPKDDIEKVKLASSVKNGILSYTILNEFIEGVYIYSKNGESITSASSTYSLPMFYDSVYRIQGMSYEEFVKYIGKPVYNKMEAVILSEGGDKNTEKVLFLSSLPDPSGNLGTLIVIIEKDKYLNIISNSMKWDNSYYYIYNDKNELVNSNDKEQVYTKNIEDNLSNKVNSKVVKTSKGKVLEVKVDSSYNGWKYVAVIPYKAFTSEINNVKGTTFFIIGICIIIGFIVSFLLANKNYRHIKNIVSFIKDTYGNENEEMDDFKLITNILKSSYKEITTNRTILENQVPLIKESYIKKLLLEGADEKAEADSKEFLNIKLDFKKYIVVLFRISSNNQSDKRSKNALDKFAIRSVVQELFSEQFSGYISEIEDNTIAYICGVYEEVEEQVEEKLINTATHCTDFINEKIHIEVECGVGNFKEDHQYISKSYEEALEALNYSIFNNEGLTLYKNICRSSKLFVYPVQKEIQLINYVKNGKRDQALKVIDQIYEENCLDNLSYEMVKLLLLDLYCSIIKLLGEIKINNNNPIFDMIKNYNDQSFSNRDALCILEDIKKLTSMVCEVLEKQRSQSSSDLKDRIIKYIDDNYTSSQISLEEVADNFNITPQYLSKFFKESIGINYLNYINEKRIENAIECLKQSEKVKDTAIKSGFDNIGTFINVFKKHVGVTPGEYKEKMGL